MMMSEHQFLVLAVAVLVAAPGEVKPVGFTFVVQNAKDQRVFVPQHLVPWFARVLNLLSMQPQVGRRGE